MPFDYRVPDYVAPSEIDMLFRKQSGHQVIYMRFKHH